MLSVIDRPLLGGAMGLIPSKSAVIDPSKAYNQCVRPRRFAEVGYKDMKAFGDCPHLADQLSGCASTTAKVVALVPIRGRALALGNNANSRSACFLAHFILAYFIFRYRRHPVQT